MGLYYGFYIMAVIFDRALVIFDSPPHRLNDYPIDGYQPEFFQCAFRPLVLAAFEFSSELRLVQGLEGHVEAPVLAELGVRAVHGQKGFLEPVEPFVTYYVGEHIYPAFVLLFQFHLFNS